MVHLVCVVIFIIFFTVVFIYVVVQRNNDSNSKDDYCLFAFLFVLSYFMGKTKMEKIL